MPRCKNVDILVGSERKTDSTSPPGQFLIEGLKPTFRYDRNQYGGGIIVFIREGIPSRELKSEFSVNMECIIAEINLHKKKWALLGIYSHYHKMRVGSTMSLAKPWIT